MIEYKRWGVGQSVYEAFLKVDYNPISKTFHYVSLGFIQKEGSTWKTMFVDEVATGKSRKEVTNKLVSTYFKNNESRETDEKLGYNC